MKWVLGVVLSLFAPGVLFAQAAAAVPTPTDVKPGSITCEDVPYPYAVSYLPMTLYGQDIRMAFMDVAPEGQPNGRTVVLFHGMNFAGFYWGGPIDALRREGFRVIVPDQIGFGRSSKPIIPYNFHDMARNTRLLLQHLKLEKASIVGHSMGGMLAARLRRNIRTSPSGSSSTIPSVCSTLDSSALGEASMRLTSAPSRTRTRTFMPGFSDTFLTTRRRGNPNSRNTCASATRGPSAPTGRGTRWCRRCSGR